MSTKNTRHKLIEAERLLAARHPQPETEYQRGWNDALTAAVEEETGLIILTEKKEDG